jgi:hypothetical protein
MGAPTQVDGNRLRKSRGVRVHPSVLKPLALSPGGWVRVLASECIKKLCPVYFNSNGSEYLIALTMNKHEGYLYLGTIRGKTLSPQVLLPHHVPWCPQERPQAGGLSLCVW